MEENKMKKFFYKLFRRLGKRIFLCYKKELRELRLERLELYKDFMFLVKLCYYERNFVEVLFSFFFVIHAFFLILMAVIPSNVASSSYLVWYLYCFLAFTKKHFESFNLIFLIINILFSLYLAYKKK